jgi:hypothetical protein
MQKEIYEKLKIAKNCFQFYKKIDALTQLEFYTSKKIQAEVLEYEQSYILIIF